LIKLIKIRIRVWIKGRCWLVKGTDSLQEAGGHVPKSLTWDQQGEQKSDQELQNEQTLTTKGKGWDLSWFMKWSNKSWPEWFWNPRSGRQVLDHCAPPWGSRRRRLHGPCHRAPPWGSRATGSGPPHHRVSDRPHAALKLMEPLCGRSMGHWVVDSSPLGNLGVRHWGRSRWRCVPRASVRECGTSATACRRAGSWAAHTPHCLTLVVHWPALAPPSTLSLLSKICGCKWTLGFESLWPVLILYGRELWLTVHHDERPRFHEVLMASAYGPWAHLGHHGELSGLSRFRPQLAGRSILQPKAELSPRSLGF
jgi:hypothetical protein